MTEATLVRDGTVVGIHYTLTDASGQVLDSSAGREPLLYLHGGGNIVPGLERQLAGRRVGDQFEAVVAAAEGYGERRGGPPQPVPRDAFPEDAELYEGLAVGAEGPNGEMIPLWITRVEADRVWLDRNHPLAGMELRFAVEVMSIREATENEVAHGHPHGPGGHHP